MSVIFYSCNGSSYYSLTKWYDWQKIEKPQNSKLPAYNEDDEKIQLLFHDQSANNRRPVVPNRKEENRKEIEEKRNRIKDKYNVLCTNLPQIQKLTDKREKAIDNFLKKFTEEQFEQICLLANSNDFLTGKNDRGWKADFDFIINLDKAVNILEGKYKNNTVQNKKISSNNYEQREYENLSGLYANLE